MSDIKLDCQICDRTFYNGPERRSASDSYQGSEKRKPVSGICSECFETHFLNAKKYEISNAEKDAIYATLGAQR